MTSAEPAVTSRADQSSWLIRWSPLGGLLFVAGMVIAFLSPYGDDTGDTPAEVIRFAEDNEGWVIAVQIFVLLSLLLLGWFVSGLYARLRAAGADHEGLLALIGGTGFSLLFFVALTIWNAPILGLTEEDNESERLEDAQTILGVDDIGWFTLGGAGVAAAVMIIAASLGALRTRSVTAWMGWVSLVLGVASLATVAFFGIFAWLAWILLASIGMLMKSRS